MIIEDDLIIAENLKENLQELGYIVIGIATRYTEAISLYNETQPDLCLTDIHLKGSKKNGIEIIQEMNIGNEIPIIYLTSFTDKQFREKAKTTNPVSYLIKPASKDQIDVSIDMAISKFNKQDKSKLLSDSNYFYVRNKGRYTKILIDDIICLEADSAYCNLYTNQDKFTVSVNMKNLLSQLTGSRLKKCHRSFAINIDQVHSFDDETLSIMYQDKLKMINLSKSYRKEILTMLPKVKTD